MNVLSKDKIDRLEMILQNRSLLSSQVIIEELEELTSELFSIEGVSDTYLFATKVLMESQKKRVGVN